MNFQDIYKNIFFSEVINKLFTSVAIVYCTVFFITIFYAPVFGDDLTYGNDYEQLFDLNRYIGEYYSWSSRGVINFFTIFFVNHQVIYKISVIALLLGASYSIYILSNRQFHFFLYLAVVTLIPLYQFNSAGYITTINNYYLPCISNFIILFFCLYSSSSSFYKILSPIAVALSIYASSFELNSLFLLFLLLSCFFIHNSNKTKHKRVIPYLCLLICILFVISHAMCPGNVKRYEITIGMMSPEVYSTLLDKLYIGFISTCYYMFYKVPFYIIYLIVIFAFLAYRSLLVSFFSGLILFFLFRFPIRYSARDLHSYIVNFFQSPNYCMKDPSFSLNFVSFYSHWLTLLSFILLITLFILLSKIKISLSSKIFIFLLILISFVIRIILGLSPTIFFTDDRGLIVSEIALLTGISFSVFTFFNLAQNNDVIFKKSFELVFVTLLVFFLFKYQIPSMLNMRSHSIMFY